MLKTEEINIRDPFVLVEDGKYYLYGTRGATCWGKADGFDCYVGTDLENWEGPVEIFHNDGSFWADRNYWAPEVWKYRGAYYLFASFKAEGVCRGTQILKADRPEGPFRIHSAGPVTPPDWECLDGTFYLDAEGRPYMVFCHEWLQVGDGEICAAALNEELTGTVGEPFCLFRASQAKDWVRSIGNGENYVTDGPFLHRCTDGTLLMLWSGMGEQGYVQALAGSSDGTLQGKWTQLPPLFEKDGGHGMIFRDLQGRLLLTLHTPNETLREHPAFYRLREGNGSMQMA